MRNVSTAAPGTDKPELSAYSADICLAHILANRRVFGSFFDELKQAGNGAVVAIQVMAKRLKPVLSGQKAGAYNGPQATVTLSRAFSACDLREATYNNAFGYQLLAAIHKRVCDASKMEDALERLYASLAVQSDIEALVHVIDRYVVALAQTNGASV